MDDYCYSCNGRGKYKTTIESEIVEVTCEECDGTGLLQEYESFQKRSRRTRYRDEDDY